MTNENPAIPAQAAAPGSDEKVITPPSNAAANAGSDSEGKVTIDLKEYRDLQRAKARTLSFDKRATLNRGKANAGQAPNAEGGDPEMVEKLNTSETARQDAERRALQSEVKLKVSDLLKKDEFKGIPQSTKDLILQNPAMLSEADNLDEALLDIEDFLHVQVGKIDVSAIAPAGGAAVSKDAPNRDTPPIVNGGAPAPSAGAEAEDPSKLRGPARSQAILRNKMKGVKPL